MKKKLSGKEITKKLNSVYGEHHAHSTECLGCKSFLLDHRPQEVPHKCPPPIVHTVDKPVEKIIYKVPTGVLPLFLSLMFAVAFLSLWMLNEKPIKESYPVYINRTDPSVQGKLDKCQSDWQADQVEKKLLKLKIKRLEMP